MDELPRLSAVLRSKLNGDEYVPVPIDEQTTRRAEKLRAQVQNDGQELQQGCLDWTTFAGPHVSSGEGHVRAVKSVFLKFLDVVAACNGVDGDRSSASAAARTTYAFFIAPKLLHMADGSSNNKSLSSVLHVPVDAKSFNELRDCCDKLYAWRTAQGLAKDGVEPLVMDTSSSSSQSSFLFRPVHSAVSAPAFAAALSYSYAGLAGLRLPALVQEEATMGVDSRTEGDDDGPRTRAGDAVSGEAPAASYGGRIDAMWLYAQSKAFVRSSGSALTPLAVSTSLLDIFKKYNSPSDEGLLQAALFELLGETAFDLMGLLIQHAQALSSLSSSELKRIDAAITTAAGIGIDAAALAGGRGAPRRPVMGKGVIVQSADDKRAEKARRKAEQKIVNAARALDEAGINAQDLAGLDGPMDALEAAGFTAEYLAIERALGLQGGDVPLYGRVPQQGRAAAGSRYSEAGLISADTVIAAVGAGYGGQQKRVLPEGTVEEKHEGWVEMIVPPVRPSSGVKFDPSRLINISQLDPWVQEAFKGVKHLNRLQSELFESAFKSNENLLVCAPTGAGKTNVAMLAVCHELAQHIEIVEQGHPYGAGKGWYFRNKEFKIIYVAPMKALAQEVVAKFSERLGGLGMSVKELTGDMQLSKREIAETQIIVTTPEKWDVITRKSVDGGFVSQVRLLIIDEVHLLADSRGAVIESLVARTLRQVETSQSIIRIVGLSATLPNYEDVAMFLRVNPQKGLWYFNDAYRPVPLQQRFIGITETNTQKAQNLMTKVAFEKAIAAVQKGKQVMVFVHSRKDTAKTARALRDLAQAEGWAKLLSPLSGVEAEEQETDDGSSRTKIPQPSMPDAKDGAPASSGLGPAAASSSRIQGESRLHLNAGAWLSMQRDIEKSRNTELRELYPAGFGIHHAGMLRSDRLLTERMFAAGVTKILVCTATLAWGVNLPAHTVIIKGTQIYDAQHGGYNDLGMLDVMQIFGRAGRPQFDTSGEGIIITTGDRYPHYLSMLTSSIPIESNFIKALEDHLNAEIVSGTVTNVREAVTWLSYTYLYVRMLRNPLAYGVTMLQKEEDPLLDAKRLKLITDSAQRLDECRMIRYNRESGNLAVTDVGRVASHYYVGHSSISTFNGVLEKGGGPTGQGLATDADVLNLICHAHEFTQVKVRDEELQELGWLRSNACPVPIKGDVNNHLNKTNVLLQAFISGAPLRSFTLISDTGYITQSAGRISRALFEICLRKGWSSLAERLLTVCKSIDKKVWWMASPLRQFNHVWNLQPDVVKKLEDCGQNLDQLADMGADELGALVRHPKLGTKLLRHLREIPYVDCETEVQPITRSILRVRVKMYPSFEWVDRLHGSAEPFWLWVEDAENEHIYHSEYVLLTRQQVTGEEGRAAGRGRAKKGGGNEDERPSQGADGAIELFFTIPIFEPLPPQYWLRLVSDRWLGCEYTFELPFRKLVLPDKYPPHTDLLDLQPLSRSCLHDPGYEAFYSFSHFNPIQTQIFYPTYNTDISVLVGAPTGSGKTVTAELAIFRLFNAHPGQKAVYIAPLKALVNERMQDWSKKFGPTLTGAGGKARRVVELTGDVTPDIAALQAADIIVTTPEKWDGVSRAWQRRGYVSQVGLVIIDEIHLLGEDRGPVLEVIVSRMRYIAAHHDRHIRFVGLSTALANPGDLANWLGIPEGGVYNFRPSVRPIPMEVHISGFPGKHYCPRMATMNKPAFSAIKTYSADKPVLIFVSSRRQTRLTALDLIALCAGDVNPRRFVRMSESEAENAVARAKDQSLKDTLAFGIGIHHAGLPESDRTLVEELFCSVKIQVLVCTSTLAWGVNFPAHLVVVKGTEYFDAGTHRYVDYPITDVLQMMGRAGRPQFDTQGVSVILVHEPKKNFYKKFLYEPFPVESQLKGQLVDHINAEIAGGTISSSHDAVEYITWTYLFRRLVKNPTYYGLADASTPGVRTWLYTLIEEVLVKLEDSGCIIRGQDAYDMLLEKQEVADDASKARKKPLSPDVSAAVAPVLLGHIASFYYVAHNTVGMFEQCLPDVRPPGSFTSSGSVCACTSASSALIEPMLRLLCDAAEFAGLPVRHNEDGLNQELAEVLPWDTSDMSYSSPHTKAFLLLQARMAGAPLPISDYVTDTKTVLDSSVRVLNALVDVAAGGAHLAHAISAMQCLQCIVQARMPEDDPILQLPYIGVEEAAALLSALQMGRLSPARRDIYPGAQAGGIPILVQLAAAGDDSLRRVLSSPSPAGCALQGQEVTSFLRELRQLPLTHVTWTVKDDSGKVMGQGGNGTVHGAGEVPSKRIAVTAGCDLSVTLDIRPPPGWSWARRAYTPGFSKAKEYGWWAVVGSEDGAYAPEGEVGAGQPDVQGIGGELVALKRLSALGGREGRGGTQTLLIEAPTRLGQAVLQVHLVSDTIAGLDQQFLIYLQVQ